MIEKQRYSSTVVEFPKHLQRIIYKSTSYNDFSHGRERTHVHAHEKTKTDKAMGAPTKNDWIQLANSAESYIRNAVVEVFNDIFHIHHKCEKLKKSIDWSWEVFTDADGQPKAIYWDNATEEEREMLDYFAKFDHAQRNALEKMRQALKLIGECKEIMKGITNLEKSK